jgi:2-aminoadipate transaminase
MQDALILSAQPGNICFSLGLPSPQLFPIEVFSRACEQVLAYGPAPLQYGMPSAALKSHIVSLMQTRGVDCSEQEIFLTSGAQQAVGLMVALLLDQGRQVIAEDLCYPGFQQIIRFYQPQILSVPTDIRTGMDVEKVEWYLARGARPAFIYTIPDGHNPLGVSLSMEKRIALLKISQKYRVPIIEEDPYGFLSYLTPQAKPMRAHQKDLVFYAGSFSKILAPSVRVGWLVVPEKLTSHLAILKEASDIDMATFSQHVVSRMLDSNFLSRHLDLLRSEYRCRRDVMLAALAKEFPAGSEWSSPDAGVFVWVRLPKEFDTERLMEQAIKKYHVAFMPGFLFSATGDRHNARSCLRLNFSFPPIPQIQEGLLRLAELFADPPKTDIA